MIPSEKVAKLTSALPFWVSLSLVPVILFAAKHGGWALILPVLASWGAFSVLDVVTGLYTENTDTETADGQLYWYDFIVLIWFPVQFFLIFGLIWYVTATDHLSAIEKICLFFGVGIASGTVGINYSHELMHRSSRLERWLGDLLLASVLYSHFRSEHLLVHHTYVGTPRDAVASSPRRCPR